MSAPTLSPRQLGRATLARQFLLERSDLPAFAAIEHLAGLQAQTTQSWYTGLWSRLSDLDAPAVGALLESRELVRVNSLRSTIHLLSAADALAIYPLTRPVMERMWRGSFTRFWTGLDLEAVAEQGRRLLADGAALTASELGAALQQRWPERDRLALAMAVRSVEPLAHVPPRGVWGKSGLARMTQLEQWLGRPVAAEPDVDALVLRYLRAFGPASVMDAQAWCGLTRLGEVFDRLRSRLKAFTDEAGRELFDLPEAPRPPADTPAPVRFLYDYDNVLLSYADRSRMGSYDFFGHGWTADGPQPSCLLLNGEVGATWLASKVRGQAVLEVRTFAVVAGRVRREIEEEGARLLEFLQPKATSRDVRVSVAP